MSNEQNFLFPNAVELHYQSEAIVRGVQAEMFPLEKNYLRSEQGLLDSLAKLEKLWEQVQGNPKQDSVRDVEFSRRAAALTAVARWAYFSALHRTETRSEHIRIDYPETNPNQRYYQATGGLDKLWVRRDWITDAMSGDKPQSVYATSTVQTTQTTPTVSKL
ncbi:FAD-binding protein [Nostoc sp.]|uniref:FAD-binding protein n=1 Tax=Nostoc sp. TaxID=1180 RepID=UPI002FF50DBA